MEIHTKLTKMVIQEEALERFVQCPMMSPTGPSKVELCAYALASWALRKSFEGRFSGEPGEILDGIRKQLIKEWKAESLPGDPGQLARVAGFRLFNLILDYEVVHPEQPYNLILTEYTIQGRYVLLRKRKGARLPHILILHPNAPTIKHEMAIPPSIKAMARYFHITTTTKYTDSQILHYPVFKGKLWIDKGFKRPLVHSYLQDMLKAASLRPKYPVSGKHCDGCTRPCMEAYDNG